MVVLPTGKMKYSARTGVGVKQRALAYIKYDYSPMHFTCSTLFKVLQSVVRAAPLYLEVDVNLHEFFSGKFTQCRQICQTITNYFLFITY